MKKTIIVIAAIAVLLVVAYNGYKAVQIITSSSSQEPEESDSAVAASAALTSTDEKAVPSPSVEPVESQTPARTPAPHRVDLQHHFLASEGKMFLTFSRNGLLESRFFKETDTPETDIATLAIANSTGSSPTDIAELSRLCDRISYVLSVDESGFVQFDFEEEAEALLAKNNIKVGSIKGLIAVSGKRVVIGKSGNSFHERLTNNFPFGEGQGSFAEVVATGADKDVYGRITGGPDELPDHRLIRMYSDTPKGVEFSWDEEQMFTRFKLYVAESPEWVSYLARNEKLVETPLIPPNISFGLAAALPLGASREPLVNLIWSFIYPEPDYAAQMREQYAEGMGITPSDLLSHARSRCFLFCPGDKGVSAERFITAFDVKRTETVRDIVDLLKAGSVFGDRSVMVMNYRGKKIFYPEGESSDFGVADTGQFLMTCASKDTLMEALGHYGSSTTGIYGGLPQEIADPVAKDASVLLFFRTKFWPDSLRDIPSSNGRRILFGLKFFAGSLIIDCTDEPGLYMPQFTHWLSQRAGR